MDLVGHVVQMIVRRLELGHFGLGVIYILVFFHRAGNRQQEQPAWP